MAEEARFRSELTVDITAVRGPRSRRLDAAPGPLDGDLLDEVGPTDGVDVVAPQTVALGPVEQLLGDCLAGQGSSEGSRR